MSIVDFDYLKITTMTVVADIIGDALIEYTFPLLPITKLDIPKSLTNSKKFKIPWPGPKYAGSIFSCKYINITRGIIKSNKIKSFRNSVGIDICTSDKNISAKLSKNKIHMCGATSEKVAIECAQHILDHLIKIQKELDYISEHQGERDTVINWLIRETKGEQFIINEETQDIIELEDGENIRNNIVYDIENKAKYNYKEVPFKWEDGDNINADNIFVNKYGQPYYRSLTKKEKKDKVMIYPMMKIDETLRINLDGDRIPTDDKKNKFNKVCRYPMKVMEVTSVKFPQSITRNEAGGLVYPNGINTRIADFLINYISDYAYHHVLIDFFENFKEISQVYAKHEDNGVPVELSVGKLNIAMINYSFSLNMNVDRWQLCQLIDGYKGFSATFNNSTDHHVTITVPYTPENNEIIKRKEVKVLAGWYINQESLHNQVLHQL